MIRALILCIALSGCAGHVRSTPVPIACVAPGSIPAEPESVKPQLTGDAVNDSAVLAIGLLEWKSHAIRLRALLKGCE